LGRTSFTFFRAKPLPSALGLYHGLSFGRRTGHHPDDAEGQDKAGFAASEISLNTPLCHRRICRRALQLNGI
jgi:hypothetical protein